MIINLLPAITMLHSYGASQPGQATVLTGRVVLHPKIETSGDVKLLYPPHSLGRASAETELILTGIAGGDG